MSDDTKKRKKRNRNKNKKKGNNAGPLSANTLEFKVDVATPEDENENKDVATLVDKLTDDQLCDNGKLETATGEEPSHDTGEEEDDNINPGKKEKVVCEDQNLEHESNEELRETDVYEEHPEVHTHSVITTTTTTYEMGESPGDENVVVDVDSSIIQVEDAVAETISEFLENDKVHGDQLEPGTPVHSLLSQNDGNLIVDVQTSPWKVDTDVQEIVEHNKRVRMTKVTKSRRVIITKTETGEEIETVVEEEDDDNPEVIGEIGAFGETENETVEIQRIVKKRRIIMRKTVDGEEIETLISDDELDREHEASFAEQPYEETTLVTTRKVIITQNEMGEDIETIVEEDQQAPEGLQEGPDADDSKEGVKEIDSVPSECIPEVSDRDRKGRLEVICHKEDKDVIQAPVEVSTVESEVDFHALLGPADEEHEKALEQQKEHVHICQEPHDHHEDKDETIRVSLEGKEVVNEECTEIRRDGKVDDIIIHGDDKPGSNCDAGRKYLQGTQPVKTLTIRSKPQAQTKHELTEEQKQMLNEVQMPEDKNVLDDWVLVNFTAKEIAKFAELVRFRPGWMDDSVEMQQCCKMM